MSLRQSKLSDRSSAKKKPMSPSSQWTLFIARPGRDRQHAIRDPQGEPRILFGEDDGTRINDGLARYLVESLNAGLEVEDPSPDEGWFLDSQGDGDEQDPAILICDPDFEIRLEILDTEDPEEDQALGRRIVALINRYFFQREGSHPRASDLGSPTDEQRTGSNDLHGMPVTERPACRKKRTIISG